MFFSARTVVRFNCGPNVLLPIYIPHLYQARGHYQVYISSVVTCAKYLQGHMQRVCLIWGIGNMIRIGMAVMQVLS